MVSINTRDTMGIRMLQKEKVEVGVQKQNLGVQWLMQHGVNMLTYM